MTDVYIVGAARTPIGRFLGALSSMPAPELGALAVRAAVGRAGVDPGAVEDVIIGNVVQAGVGQAPARQAALGAGLPSSASATTINKVCASGLEAINSAALAIRNGDADIIIAGGMESMSMAPHCAHLRGGVKMGDFKMIDTMIKDGLTDAFYGYHMGITAENVARKWQLTREEQDEFALASQNKAEAAQKAGRFADEIVPFVVKTRKGDVTVDQDEYIRHGATLDSIAKLRPAFDKEGTVTAGNASGLNDGAAAALLMTEAEATRRGIQPLARIVSWATAGVDPQIMGTGPIPASRKALEKAGWSVADIELVEANEAFAAQACAVNKDLGWDPSIVNVNGGAIAIGHPIGASGARVLNTLLFEMKRRGVSKGLATLCIGGGMGVAMCVERL
jgi:acetyl-CoA C-acetyltransferase